MRRYGHEGCRVTDFFVLGDADDVRCVAFVPTMTRGPARVRFVLLLKEVVEVSRTIEPKIVTDEEVADEYTFLTHPACRSRHERLFAAVKAIMEPPSTSDGN